MERDKVFVGNLVKVVKIKTRPDENHHTIFTRFYEPIKGSETILFQRHENAYLDIINNKSYNGIYYADEGDVCVYDKDLININDYFNEVSINKDINKSQIKQLAKHIQKK